MKYIFTFLSILILSISGYSQNTIWGTAAKGGKYNCGYLYRTDSIGDHVVIVHHFNHTIDGNVPGPVMQASNGKLYGMTFTGGQGVVMFSGPTGADSTQGGTFYEYDPVLDSLKILRYFNSTDSQYPSGFHGPSTMRILEATPGNLWCIFNVTKPYGPVSSPLPRYILSYAVATNSMTTVGMLPSWTTTMYPGDTFNTYYSGELYKAANGFIYGTTAGYSSCATTTDANNGSIIRIHPLTYAFLYIRPFPCTYVNGWLPESNLAEVGGKFYSTTRWGGPALSLPTNFGYGVIYEYDPAGNTYTKKYDFQGGSLGAYAVGYQVKANNGKLYGTTFFGTPYTNFPSGTGVLYEYDAVANTYAKKKDFTNSYYLNDIGANGYLWLKAHSGKLYGTTQTGLFEYDVTLDQIRPAGRFNAFNQYPTALIEICRKPAYKLNAATNYTMCAGSFFSYDLHCDNAAIVWKQNGTAVPTQTTSLLSFNHLTVSDAGTWVCEMTNDCGTTISPTLTLVINPSGAGVFTSTLVPAGTNNICPNSTITLSGNNGGIWNTGATSSSLSVSTPGGYQVVNTNTCGITFSNIITIDTIPSPYKPIITFTTTPGLIYLNPTICPGDSILLTGNTNGIWNTGETSNSIYVKDTLKHYVVANNGCKSMTSDTAKASYYQAVLPPVINAAGALQICSGDSVLLTTQNFIQITWYNIINNNMSIIGGGTTVYAKQTGDYYVKYSTTCGPVYSQTIHINADTLALDTAIVSASGPLVFCQGGGVTLQSNNSNCVWSTGETTQTITASYSGQYYVTNHNSCSSVTSAMVDVTVTPAPVVNYTEPANPICLTTPAFTLAPASPGGGMYSGTGVTGNTFDPALAGSGTHTVSYSFFDNTTGCTGVATQSIYVDYDPTIMVAGSSSLCAGSTAVLVQLSGNGTWNTGLTGPVLTTTIAGNYYVTQTNICGNAVSSNTIQITSIPLPMQPLITQIGNYLLASSATTFQWYLNGSMIPGATSQTYTPTQNGDYTVLISDPNGCYNTSVIYPFLVTGMQPAIPDSDEIRLFPNPNTGSFRIILPKQDCKVIITNSIGQIVQEKTLSCELEHDFQLNQSGVYFVEISTPKASFIKKMVVYNK